MGTIQLLDEALASQIAAGEVVERPASVVKELLENALDAGATQIDVVCDGGGVERLIVVDDGAGMVPEDATMCFSRHATSKVRALSDLEAIATYGFRGEALAAIASVARVRLVTRPPDAEIAAEVRVEGGRIVHVGETGAPVGSRVEVADLFFNVPARRKFLKTERTESGHVDGVVRTAALSQPGVGFRLTTDGKIGLDVGRAPAEATLEDPRRRERAITCLGARVRDHLYAFSADSDLIKLSGFAVAPHETRRDLAGVHVSVNGRPVSDRGLVQAVRVAYRTLLEVGRQPICALDLEIDPAFVDVNVHPRKAEVRFDDPRRVHGHLIRLLGDFLVTTPWLKKAPSRTYVLSSAGPQPSTDDPAAAHRDRARKALRELAERRAPPERSGWSEPPEQPRSEPGFGSAGTFSALRTVGQVGLTYLVLEGPDGMVVIDQHAAHERVMFEELREGVKAGRTRSQPLLFPLQVELSPLEMGALEEHGEVLAGYGLEVEPFGEGAAMIRAVPHGLDGGQAEGIARDALAELADRGRPDALDDLVDRVCSKLACHGSVRAGQGLDAREIDALLRALDRIDLGAHCPHGRPVVRTLAYDEMARWFDRR
jgi:DNA mismatch repair protein MutL